MDRPGSEIRSHCSCSSCEYGLRIIPPLGPASDRIFLVVSLFAIPRLCRILTAYEETGKIDFAVLLGVGSARKIRGAWQERLLDNFHDCKLTLD